MKIQYDTVKYYLEDALIEINKILVKCKNKTLDEVSFKVDLEHALHMFNFAYNARYLTRKEASELSDKEYDMKTLPPNNK